MMAIVAADRPRLYDSYNLSVAYASL